MWCCNHATLLEAVHPDSKKKKKNSPPLQWDDNEHVKTLGRLWLPAQGQLQEVSGTHKDAKSTSTHSVTRTALAISCDV
jgi:hypothetical protein